MQLQKTLRGFFCIFFLNLFWSISARSAPQGRFDCNGWKIHVNGHHVTAESPVGDFNKSGAAKYHSAGKHETLHLVTRVNEPLIYLLTDKNGRWVLGAGPVVDPDAKGFKCEPSPS